MSDTYKKLLPHPDPTVFTTEVVLEREDGENGEPTVVAQVGVPTKGLTAEHVKTLESMGFKVESSSKQEFEQVEQSGVSGPAADIVGSGPTLGNTSSNPAPGEGPSEGAADDNDNKSGSSRSSSGEKK